MQMATRCPGSPGLAQIDALASASSHQHENDSLILLAFGIDLLTRPVSRAYDRRAVDSLDQPGLMALMVVTCI
jgi:hypothetical protein